MKLEEREKIRNLIKELNAIIEDKNIMFDHTMNEFSITDNGQILVISFGDTSIWDSETDCRKYYEETDTYESWVNLFRRIIIEMNFYYHTIKEELLIGLYSKD